MRIKIINPNTSRSDDRRRSVTARRAVADVGHDDRRGQPGHGAGLRSRATTTKRLAVPGLLQEDRGRRASDGFDGYVIACFGDPGLKAARELARGPGGRHRGSGHAHSQLPRRLVQRGDHPGPHHRHRRSTSPRPMAWPASAPTCAPASCRCWSWSGPAAAPRERIVDELAAGRSSEDRQRGHRARLRGHDRSVRPHRARRSACRSSMASPQRRCRCSRWCVNG